MKNISMQSLQASPMKNTLVKSTAEPTGKSDVNASNLDSGVLPSPFQMALSKQVQVKQAHAKPSQIKPAPQNNIGAVKNALTSQTSPKQSRADQLADSLQNLVKHPVQDNHGGQELVVDPLIGEQTAEDTGNINLLQIESPVLAGADSSTKELLGIGEAPSDKVKNSATDPGFLGLVASVTTPMTNVNSLAGSQMSEVKVNVDASQDQPGLDVVVANMFLPPSEHGTQLKPDYDGALSKALSPSQNGSASESDPKNNPKINQGGASGLEVTRESDHTHWLDAMLPNTTKPNALANEGEAFDSKLSLSAIQGGIELSPKGVVLPPSLQVAAQVSATLNIQQAGSANTISSYPGKSGWDQAISQKVMWMVGVGEQSATLTLNPPDLGPLQVVIRVHNDQADTTFISGNAEVRQALENGLSNLRDKMSESGIQLGHANVSAGNQSQQEFQRATQNRSAAPNTADVEDSTLLGLENPPLTVRNNNGLVDTFA